MKKPRVPECFVADVSSLTKIFKMLAINRGLTAKDAITATNLIPEALRSLTLLFR